MILPAPSCGHGRADRGQGREDTGRVYQVIAVASLIKNRDPVSHLGVALDQVDQIAGLEVQSLNAKFCRDILQCADIVIDYRLPREADENPKVLAR